MGILAQFCKPKILKIASLSLSLYIYIYIYKHTWNRRENIRQQSFVPQFCYNFNVVDCK